MCFFSFHFRSLRLLLSATGGLVHFHDKYIYELNSQKNYFVLFLEFSNMWRQAKSVYEFSLKTLAGVLKEEIALSEYKGKVLFIVNVASK